MTNYCWSAAYMLSALGTIWGQPSNSAYPGNVNQRYAAPQVTGCNHFWFSFTSFFSCVNQMSSDGNPESLNEISTGAMDDLCFLYLHQVYGVPCHELSIKQEKNLYYLLMDRSPERLNKICILADEIDISHWNSFHYIRSLERALVSQNVLLPYRNRVPDDFY